MKLLYTRRGAPELIGRPRSSPVAFEYLITWACSFVELDTNNFPVLGLKETMTANRMNLCGRSDDALGFRFSTALHRYHSPFFSLS